MSAIDFINEEIARLRTEIAHREAEIKRLEQRREGMMPSTPVRPSPVAAPVRSAPAAAAAVRPATDETRFDIAPKYRRHFKNLGDFNKLPWDTKNAIFRAVLYVFKAEGKDVPFPNIGNPTCVIGSKGFPKDAKGKSMAFELMTTYTTLEVYDSNKRIRIPVEAAAAAPAEDEEDAAAAASDEE